MPPLENLVESYVSSSSFFPKFLAFWDIPHNDCWTGINCLETDFFKTVMIGNYLPEDNSTEIGRKFADLLIFISKVLPNITHNWLTDGPLLLVLLLKVFLT